MRIAIAIAVDIGVVTSCPKRLQIGRVILVQPRVRVVGHDVAVSPRVFPLPHHADLPAGGGGEAVTLRDVSSSTAAEGAGRSVLEKTEAAHGAREERHLMFEEFLRFLRSITITQRYIT